MKKLLLILLVVLLSCMVFSQDTNYSIFSYGGFIPKVKLNARSGTLQQALLPKMYTDRSAYGDLRWVRENDSAISAFWGANSSQILHILSELSGLDWSEREFDIYLVRHAPTVGAGEPIVLPVGGIVDKGLIEAMPLDNRWILNLIYQLAHRMLAQADRPEGSVYSGVASHPLMRPGPYRRDVLAMFLALNTAQTVIGFDSTEAAWTSAFWQRWFPGRQILQEYLAGKWELTPTEPLINWIGKEAYGSDFVRATQPPRKTDDDIAGSERVYVEGLPLKGILGFSVTLDDRNRLVIDQIDSLRLAYANGLRIGDVVRRADGALMRTNKALIEKILAGLDQYGAASLEIIRNNQTMTIVLQTVTLPDWAEDAWEYEPTDSLSTDSLAPDTAGYPDIKNR